MTEIEISDDTDFVDGTEGFIFFDSFAEKNKFGMRIWGLTLLGEFADKYHIKDHDVYISAFSDIIFEDVKYIHLDYKIYNNSNGTEFRKDISENDDIMTFEFGSKNELDGYRVFDIGGVLGRYVGFGEMAVYYRGSVRLIFDETATVSVREYCLDPKKYRLKEG